MTSTVPGIKWYLMSETIFNSKGCNYVVQEERHVYQDNMSAMACCPCVHAGLDWMLILVCLGVPGVVCRNGFTFKEYRGRSNISIKIY